MIRNAVIASIIFATIGAASAQTPPAPVVPSPADPVFPVNLQSSDATTIRQVCDFARMSSTINLETAQAVAAYCTNLLTKIGVAAEAAKHPPDKK